MSQTRPPADDKHARLPQHWRVPVLAHSLLKKQFLECYVSWREASEDVQMAYDGWREAEPTWRAGAFFAYRAALDREESAARDYCDVAERLRRPVRRAQAS
jgi:hypothetical protein